MAPKRHLGLGKAAKAKKQKKEVQEAEEPQAQELTVELNEELDPEDDIGQLKALWKTYKEGDKESELVVNGIIHECDRILRKNALEKDPLQDTFYAIYGLALASLCAYHSEDKKAVKEFFAAALERVEDGLERHSLSIELLFTKAKILIDEIPLLIISSLSIDSEKNTSNDVGKKLDEALVVYETAEHKSKELANFEFFNADHLDILQALDDVLDMIDNFGKENMEGEESDDEEEDEVELAESHPLYAVKNSDKYNQWWRDHTLVFLEGVDQRKDKNADLRTEICKRIGQSYLLEAEVPMNVFTTLMYDDTEEDEINGLNAEQAGKIGRELISKALEYLKQAQKQSEPDTWVNVAEALISLGNLHEVDSKEQEEIYKEAEEILVRANNATNGRYEDILDNLK